MTFAHAYTVAHCGAALSLQRHGKWCTAHSSCSAAVCIVNHIPACQASDPRKLLIKGGTVVNADRKFPADVYCEEGIIRWGVIRDRANYNNIILSPLWIMCQSNYLAFQKWLQNRIIFRRSKAIKFFIIL